MYGLGLLKGLGVTMRNFVRKPFTVQYPEERLPQHPRFRGEEFTWYEQRCTGCASCAKYCPLGIIKIITHPSGKNLQEGQNYGIDVFDIDIGRCMFCGLCVEACPYDALFMGSGFEESQQVRDKLVISVDRLRKAPKKPSTWGRPQLEAKIVNSYATQDQKKLGLTTKGKYLEDKYNPQGDQELSWEDVGRVEGPNPKRIQNRWVNR
jgi:NADH-quinone oxidoreductase chain I